jgi:hypothetical protein
MTLYKLHSVTLEGADRTGFFSVLEELQIQTIPGRPNIQAIFQFQVGTEVTSYFFFYRKAREAQTMSVSGRNQIFGLFEFHEVTEDTGYYSFRNELLHFQ